MTFSPSTVKIYSFPIFSTSLYFSFFLKINHIFSPTIKKYCPSKPKNIQNCTGSATFWLLILFRVAEKQTKIIGNSQFFKNSTKIKKKTLFMISKCGSGTLNAVSNFITWPTSRWEEMLFFNLLDCFIDQEIV